MNKILISGGTGFIGHSLANFLYTNEYEVAVLARVNSNKKMLDKRIKIFFVDNNYESVFEAINIFSPDVVIHAATLFLSTHHVTNISSLVNSNVIFPTFILEAMSSQKSKKFINLSSIWQLGCQFNYVPSNLYAATKNSFEQILKYYSFNNNIEFCNIYLPDTYGQNDKRNKIINILLNYIRNDMYNEIQMSPGYQKIDLLHISDVILGIQKIINMLLQNNNLTDNYQLRSVHNNTLREIVDIFSSVSDKKINVAWGALDYRNNEIMEVKKIFQAPPDWCPTKSLEDGLRELLFK